MHEPTLLYVAPDGCDSWSGRLPEPTADNTDGPLATPQAARDALRALRQTEATGPFTVQFRAGMYALVRPLAFASEDSGSEKAPVVFTAYPGERPVFSGGCRITGWQPGEANGKPCWIADLPDVRSGAWFFTQLFVNGERRQRPRLPKTGYYRFTGVPADVDAGDGGWSSGPNGASFRPGDLAPWQNLADVKVMVLRLWFEMHHRIRALEPEKSTVRFQAKCFGSLRDEKGDFSRYFVENVFEALTGPGEWYLDRAAGRLYYLPRPGETPDTTEIIAPRLETLVRFACTEEAPVRHIRLENLTLAHAEWDYPATDAGSVQAAYKVPGAVQFDRAEHCALYGCEIAHVAQYGVEVLTGSHGNHVVGCSLHDLGAGGVRVNHEWLTRVNETAPAIVHGRADRKPMATTIADCTVHAGGRIHLSAIGLYVGNAGGNRLLHNHIFDLNYTGISCGWTWGYADTATVANRIEFNHIHHINWSRILSDNGGIYTLGIHPGSTVRGNHVHHIGCFGYGGWGLYPDEGSSEFVIEDNVVHHTPYAAFSTHYGRDNWVRNNIFALSEDAHVHPGKLEGHRTTLLERNLVLWRQGSLKGGDWRRGNFLFRNNLFWNEVGPVEFGDARALPQAQADGQHAGTLIADPLFSDPEAGEFSLRPDSPALTTLGFKPLDPRQTGPRFGGTRPPSFAAWLAGQKAEAPRAIVRTRLETPGDGKLRLTVANVGPIAANGRLRLQCWPAASIRLRGRTTYAFRDLQPGETRSAEFAFRLDPDADQAEIETVPAGQGLHPTTLLLEPRLVRLKTQPPPSAVVPRLPAPATGDPSDADWERAGRISPFRNVTASGPEVATAARAFHDGTRFYLRLVATMNTATLQSDETYWRGDYWDLFFAAARAKPYRQIMAAPDGRFATLAHGEPQEAWDSNATVRSVVQPDTWTVCLAIPLQRLIAGEKGLAPGDTLYVNFFRGANGRFFSWSPTFILGNHNLPRLGELRLEP